MKLLRFIQMTRAPFLTAVITPMLWGTVLAWRLDGRFDRLLFALTLVGLAAAHAGANLLNDYFDFRLGADRNNPQRGPFSGGSPHIVGGITPASAFLISGAACLAVALACMMALAWIVDRGIGPVAAMAALGLLGGILYTAPPAKLAYRGWGEACIFVCFGILPVVGTFYVQTGRWSGTSALASLPLAFLITNIIWINQFPDFVADRDAGKRTLVVRLGIRDSRIIYHVLASAAFVGLTGLAFGTRLGPGLCWGLLGLPFSLASALILHQRYGSPQRLIPAQGLTIAAHLVTGLALCLALGLS